MRIITVLQEWPTPTPLPMSDATPVYGDLLSDVPVTLAESFVQGWQYSDQAGALDILMTGALVLLVVGGIWSIIRHLQRI